MAITQHHRITNPPGGTVAPSKTRHINRAVLGTLVLSLILGTSQALLSVWTLLPLTLDLPTAQVVGITIVVAANTLAYLAGTKLHSSKHAAAVLAGTWLTLCSALVMMELNTPDPGVGMNSLSFLGTEPADPHLGRALLIAVLYLAAGVITAVRAHTHNTPDLTDTSEPEDRKVIG